MPTTQTLTPDHLLPRLRTGDPLAFHELVTSTTSYLLAIATRMLKSEADAQDAVQDAFLQIHKSLPKFEARSSLLTWMHRIQVTTCLMKLRSQKNKDEVSIDPLLPQFDNTNHQTHPNNSWHTPDQQLSLEETKQKVRDCINQLPESYRTILLLRDIEQLTTEETCNLLSITEPVAKTRLHRARQALKTLLDPYFSTPNKKLDLPSLLLLCYF